MEENQDKSLVVNNKVQLDIFDSPESFLNKIKNLEVIADVISKSDIYSKVFRTAKKDINGNIMKDEEGNILEEVSKSDIICCIGLGREMGLDIFGSLAFGKALNTDSYKKVMRGKSLGLDPMASLSMISIIPTGNGDIIHTGTHVISNALNRGGIRYEIIEDFKPINIYYILDSELRDTGIFVKENEYFDNKEKYYLITEAKDANELKSMAKSSGRTIIKPYITTRITTAVFKRTNYPDLTISYTLQEAIDARLYKGRTSSGEEVKGKDNWNSHPATVLRGRVITIGGRIIGSDKIHNTYSTEEAIEIKGGNTQGINITNIPSDIEEATTE